MNVKNAARLFIQLEIEMITVGFVVREYVNGVANCLYQRAVIMEQNFVLWSAVTMKRLGKIYRPTYLAREAPNQEHIIYVIGINTEIFLIESGEHLFLSGMIIPAKTVKLKVVDYRRIIKTHIGNFQS